MRVRAMLVILAMTMMPAGMRAAGAGPALIKQPVSFSVTNPADPLHGPYTIRGYLMNPSGCSSVILALHGLSYTQAAWDFPIRPETYSVSRALAGRGYATIAIDELGYGSSAGAGDPNHPNGYTLSVEAYADMTAQIITQIRQGAYVGGPAFANVGLMGHSAGSEIAELTTELHPELVDALIATAYTHEPFVNNDWLQREWFQDNIRAAQSDYEEFEAGTLPDGTLTRSADMYNLDNADGDVVKADNDMANLTPSGEVFSIGSQPSRWLQATIDKPVLLLLAARDALFPPGLSYPGIGSYGDNELALFAGTSDKTLKIVPDAGHVFMLQRNAAVGNAMIGDWLQDHSAILPPCMGL